MIDIACAGVLFDCDGVLVDSDESVVSAWTRWAVDHDFDPASVLAMVHGRRAADTVATLVDGERASGSLDLINRYEIEDAATVRAIPGALSLFSSVPPDRVAVVTSGTQPLAHARLRAAGFDPPPVVITAGDVTHGKPHPEGYLSAAARLGLDPSRTVVFEDAVTGIEAARAAGVGHVIGVGAAGLDGHADVVIADLRAARWDDGHLLIDE